MRLIFLEVRNVSSRSSVLLNSLNVTCGNGNENKRLADDDDNVSKGQ